jgi:hypothetical protein
MAIIVNLQGKQSDLQRRVAADLRAKMAANGAGEGTPIDQRELQKTPDGVADSAYVRDYAPSRALPRLVVVGIIIAVLLVICAVGIGLSS